MDLDQQDLGAEIVCARVRAPFADAMQRVDAGKCDPDEFKFFFNMAKFAGGELQQAVVDGRWSAYEGIPRAVILRQDPGADRDTLWGEIRNAARENAAA